MKTRFKILGCGNSIGVPRIDGFWGNCKKRSLRNIRSRCSAIIIKGKNNILIDTSPDIKKQFTDNNIKDLSSVLYTHEHADQTNGLFELRPFLWKNKKAIDVYGNKKTISLLKKRFDYCFKQASKMYPPIVKANIVKNRFSLRSEVLKSIPNFSKIGLLPTKTFKRENKNSLSFINENIKINKIDYFFTNSISRSSKVMSECRKIHQEQFTKDGTNN